MWYQIHIAVEIGRDSGKWFKWQLFWKQVHMWLRSGDSWFCHALAFRQSFLPFSIFADFHSCVWAQVIDRGKMKGLLIYQKK